MRFEKMSRFFCRCCCSAKSRKNLISPDNSQTDLTKGCEYYIDKLFIHKVPATVIDTKKNHAQTKLEKPEKVEEINIELSDEWTQTEEDYVKPNLVNKGTSACLIQTQPLSHPQHRRRDTYDVTRDSQIANKCDDMIFDSLSKSVNQSVKLLQSLSCANSTLSDRNANKKRQPSAVQRSRGEPNKTRTSGEQPPLSSLEILPSLGEEADIRIQKNLNPVDSELCYRSNEDSANEREYSEGTFDSHQYACSRRDTNYYSATVLPSRSRPNKNYESHLLLISNEERATRMFHGSLTEDKSGSPYFQRIPDTAKRSLKSTVAVHKVRDARRGYNVKKRLDGRGNEDRCKHLTNLWRRNETRFNLTADVMTDEDDENKKKSSEEKNRTNDRTRSTRTTTTATVQTTQGSNEAGPSRSRGRNPQQTLKDKKEVSGANSLTSLITKTSMKSVKSETQRDVIDAENKPVIAEEPPKKPVYVDISGKNLSKRDTLQILNKYSSIFVDNLKEAVPKDPLTYRRESEDIDTPLPGTAARATDLASKLSEIGSQTRSSAPNPAVYGSSNQQQRSVSESPSAESVQRIYQYEDETPQTNEPIKGTTHLLKKFPKPKPGKFLSPKVSLGHLGPSSKPKPGTSQQEPEKKDASKQNPSKRNGSKNGATGSSKTDKSPKPDCERGPLQRDPTFHARHIAVSNLDAERFTMRLEKLRKGRSASQQPSGFECDLPSQEDEEQSPRPSSAVERRVSSRQPLTSPLARSSACQFEEHRRSRMDQSQWDAHKSTTPIGLSQEVILPTNSSRKGRQSADRVEEEGWVSGSHPLTSSRSPSRGNRGSKRWKIIIKHERASSSEDSLHDEHR